MKKIVETVRLRNKRISESFSPGRLPDLLILWARLHLPGWRAVDNPSIACEAYRQSTEKLKSYMQRQWILVGGMAGTFREME